MHGDYLDIPAARSASQPTSAVKFLIETYRAATEEIVLVPTGPLTNIAAALKLEPRHPQLIPEIMLMGGGHYCGNITRSLSSNVWADPEAARVVFNCCVPRVTIVARIPAALSGAGHDDLWVVSKGTRTNKSGSYPLLRCTPTIGAAHSFRIIGGKAVTIIGGKAVTPQARAVGPTTALSRAPWRAHRPGRSTNKRCQR